MKSFMKFIPALRAKLRISAIISLWFLGACSDPATIGLDLAPQNNQIGVFYKEFILDAQVVLLDSFNTTNAGILIVGDENDDYFGNTNSTGFTRLYIDDSEERPKSDAVLDSIFFKLSTVSVNGSDLKNPKKYSVHLLKEPMLDTMYYNFSRLAYDPAPITTAEVVFGDKKDTVLTIPIKGPFVDDLFAKMKRGQEFDNLFNFRKYIPGVVVKAREGDNTTAGFSLGGNTGIIVYYHALGDTTRKKFSINTFSSRSFNGIKSDRKGTATEVVTQYQKPYSTGQIVGMKSGLGLALRINTSPIDSFLDSLSGVVFNQAFFTMGPIESQAETNVPITGMVMKMVDSQNRVLLSTINGAELHVQADGQAQVIDDGKGNLVPNNFFASVAVLEYNPTEKLHRVGVTSYLNAVFRKQIQRQDWMLYATTPKTGDDFKQSLRQFKVDKNKVKVTVIYSKTR